MLKKGQVGVREMAMTLIMAALLFTVLFLVFASVSNTADGLFDLVERSITGETLTINSDSIGADNSSLLSASGYVTNSEVVVNNTAPFALLNRNVDYRITTVGTSGSLGARANFTLLNVTNSTSGGPNTPRGFNASELLINYTTNAKSEAGLTVDVIEDTVLDAFELAVIFLIVLAAVVILSVLFTLGN